MHFISILIKALPEIKTLLQPVMKRGILLAIHTKLLNNPRTLALAFIGWDRGLRQRFTIHRIQILTTLVPRMLNIVENFYLHIAAVL